MSFMKLVIFYVVFCSNTSYVNSTCVFVYELWYIYIYIKKTLTNYLHNKNNNEQMSNKQQQQTTLKPRQLKKSLNTTELIISSY